jgi:AcrR family transcriptional regulator
MNAMPEKAAGLRARKKAKTRAAIQREALRLFREQGYDATTVDQICEAAEVSPSTFFRYFPTKEHVVLYDALDPLLMDAFRRQPPGLTIMQALRSSIREVFERLPGEETAMHQQRAMLFLSVPELRASWINDIAEAFQIMREPIAERLGRSTDDFAVQNLVGAIFGVMLVAMMRAAEDPRVDVLELIDPALAHLEAGLPL